MRKATFFGKDVYLTEKQWSQLIARFDVDRAKKDEYRTNKFRISIECFCADFNCSRCPLWVLKWGEIYGCTRIMNKLCGTSDWAFEVSMNSVYWWEEDDERARKQIQKIYTGLMCMEQVKR